MHATFSAAFLRGDPRAAGFLSADFRDPAARSFFARRAAQKKANPRIIEALRERERELALLPSSARARHLDALAEGKTAVVVTGQQVGLFLGPLYTFYKAASAVAVARAVERESGVRCVPVFWLQTEDHDFEEVSFCHIPRPGGAPLRLQLDADPQVARVSIAHRVLGDKVAAACGELRETLGSLPCAEEFLTLLDRHYSKKATLGAAFAGVLAEIFSDEGLLVLDPRGGSQGATFAALSAPIYRRAIEGHVAISAALLSRTMALRAAGFDEQVHVRPGTSLCFFHAAAATGPRYRPERKGESWMVGGECVKDAEISTLLSREPLRFSTSALLRPIVQDTLLPTMAYVGGPGEVNYLAQLGPLYDLFELPQPLVMLRARFRLLEAKTKTQLEKLGCGLLPNDIEVPRDELLRRIVSAAQTDKPSPNALREGLLSDILQKLAAIEALEPSLCDGVRRTQKSVAHNVGRLCDRYARTLLSRDSELSERVFKLQSFLYPEGMPQERYYSLPYFACKYGVRALKEKVFAELKTDPFAVLGKGSRDLLL